MNAFITQKQRSLYAALGMSTLDLTTLSLEKKLAILDILQDK